ncbi:hypothetical protein GM182_07300 [bacterium 3DAC]|nr:hypothetical protein GM182_07300 [bacterium 3DAC]
MDLPSISVKITEDGKRYLEEINKQLGVPVTLLWGLSAVLGKVRGERPLNSRISMISVKLFFFPTGSLLSLLPLQEIRQIPLTRLYI